MREKVDILIKNGLVVDGTGIPGYKANVAIIGERIHSISAKKEFQAEHIIDVNGKVVAPGFIDCHTHDDRVLLDEPDMKCKVTQGVTTVVAGNCGISLAPFDPEGEWELPIPLPLLGRRDQYRFPYFGDFVRAFKMSPPSINAAFLCGHNTLRAEAMKGEIDRAADLKEIAQMREKLRDAMKNGAIGLSSGLMYPAGFAAPTREISCLAADVGKLGGVYATHLRDEAEDLLGSVEEAAEIGREGDLPVILSHHKVTGRSNWGATKLSLKKIEKLAKRQKIYLDVYPYAASATALMPDRLSIAEKILIVSSDSYPEKVGHYLRDIAFDWGVSEIKAAERLLPAQAIYFAMDEADVRRVLGHSRAMIGSDGIPGTETPHPRLWGTFPRVLGHYSRELGLFSLETAVYKMTGLTAHVFGFKDRGVLRKGAIADITVFNPETVIDCANFEKPIQVSSGIIHVLVRGEIVFEDSALTSSRPGRLVQREAV